MPIWGYLLIAVIAYLVCALIVYMVYCVWLQHGARGVSFVFGVTLLGAAALGAVRTWRKITGRRLWWERGHDDRL